MGGRKKVLLALFVLAIFLGGFLVARGYPDWALNVMQREGTTFVVTGSVDANITNTEINAYVTNTTITIEPSEGAEFIIKPAEAVVFQIQGQVDANITNTELDVHVTNSTITIEPAAETVFEIRPATGVVFNIQGSVDANITNTELDVHVTNSTITITPEAEAVFEIKPTTGAIFNIQGDVNITNTELNVNVTNSTLNVTGDVNATVQGTVSVSVDRATIEVGVATVRERASELNKVKSFYATEHLTPQGVRVWTIYTNEGTENAYLELVSFGATSFFDVLTDPTKILGAYFEVRLKDETGEVKAVVFGNALTTLNLDPALPIPPGWKVEVELDNNSDVALDLSISVIIREG